MTNILLCCIIYIEKGKSYRRLTSVFSYKNNRNFWSRGGYFFFILFINSVRATTSMTAKVMYITSMLSPPFTVHFTLSDTPVSAYERITAYRIDLPFPTLIISFKFKFVKFYLSINNFIILFWLTNVNINFPERVTFVGHLLTLLFVIATIVLCKNLGV